MTQKQPRNLAASIHQRLLNQAHTRGETFQLLLTRYALERLLYRLSCSPYNHLYILKLYILKGATVFSIWSGQLHRATQDLDFLSSGAVDVTAVEHVFREVCRTPVEDDGLQFLESSVRAEKTRDDLQYEGLRVELRALLGNARIPLQIDIGFGDAITPGPVEAVLPTLLDFPAPYIAVYPRETAIAEKFQAMVVLGLANSRMKDFYDLWYLSQQFSFDGETLSQAIDATFSRRKTPLPTEIPFALTSGFTQHPDKQKQWIGFLKKTRLPANTMSLDEIAAILVDFLMPPTLALVRGECFTDIWPMAGLWQPAS